MYVLVFVLAFVGLGGMYGSLMMLADPSGARLGMTTDLLTHGPFSDYLFPGIVLLVFNGLLPLVVAYGLLVRPDWPAAERLNVYKNRHWAWTYALYTGFGLCIWINVQLLMINAHSALQPVFGLVGVLILALALLPGVMARFARE
jgi:hypothetical protein